MAFKYQIIKLNQTLTAGLLKIFVPDGVFPLQQYNNVHSFCIYLAKKTNIASFEYSLFDYSVRLIEISEFKISEHEIIGSGTPVMPFCTGASEPTADRFTEINIPNKFKQITFNLNLKRLALGGGFTNFGDVYLILKMNNVKPEEHFKNYYRYETFKKEFLKNVYEKNSFSFRPKVAAKNLVGIHVVFNSYKGTQIEIANILSAPVARLSLQVNNRQSLPVVMHLRDYLFQNIKRKAKFLELNEPITPSSFISGIVISDPNNIKALVSTYNFYLICKYTQQ